MTCQRLLLLSPWTTEDTNGCRRSGYLGQGVLPTGPPMIELIQVIGKGSTQGGKSHTPRLGCEPEWDISSALSLGPHFRHCGETGLGSPGGGQPIALRLGGRDHFWVIQVGFWYRGVAFPMSTSTAEWSAELGQALPTGAGKQGWDASRP